MATRPFESKIQDIVYNVDVGIGLRLTKLGLYLLFLLSIMVLYTATQFRGLKDAEAMDYAQLGRNLMRSGKMVTQVVRPASMWYLIEHTKDANPRITDHPDILHPPVYPALLAAGFKATGGAVAGESSGRTYPPEQWVVIPVNLLFTVATGVLVFFLARRLFDARVAALGITLFFLSDTTWQTAISGTGLSVAIAWTTAAIYTAIVAASRRAEGRPMWSWLVLAGFAAIFTALAALTRYGAIALAPAIALYLGHSAGRNKGWLTAGAFLAVVALLIAPWLARNVMVSGSPLGLAPYMVLNGQDPVLENVFERTLAQDLKLGTVLSALQGKLLTGIHEIYTNGLRTLGDGFLVCFFLTTFFYSFARDNVRRLRWAAALGLFLLILIGALYGASAQRLLQLFWPVVILYGTAFFYILLDRMQLRIPLLRIGVTAAFLILNALPLALTLLPPRAGVPYPPYYAPYITHVSRMMQPQELLCTDMPWATAWYGDRTSLLLPSTLDEFYSINDFTKRISGIYFTTITRDREYVSTLLTGPLRTWFPIMEGRIPNDFPLTQGFPLSNMDQLFLTDRQRW